MIDEAIEFALRYHGEQKYGEHPYICHLKSVQELGEKLGSIPMIQVACILHDILEDTTARYADIVEVFGFVVADIVWYVTKSDNELYESYIRRVAQGSNHYAKEVKVLDLLCNLQESIKSDNKRLIYKYQNALLIMSGVE